MESREKLRKGGRHGAGFVVGKGKESNLVRYLTGEHQPKMPPGGAMDLEKVGLLRRWIDEGAKVDSLTAVPTKPNAPFTKIPAIKIGQQPAPVTALAYSPDGKTLAAGGYRVVRLLNPETGEVTKTVPGLADQVQSVAWSSDGRFLAAAGGVPGQEGEVVLFDAQNWQPVRSLKGHSEVVYAVAWKPNSPELATGSLDKTARIWNTQTGQETRLIKDHAEAVFGVAYSPDGKLLVTGSADRSAKLFDTTTWKRVATLTAHQDAVTRVAFSPNGKILMTGGADKAVRVWKVQPGQMENPERTIGDDDVINACAFSPDGNLFAFGAASGCVRLFNGDGSQQKQERRESKDWVYCVSIGSDNQTVAAGTQDGKILFWNAKEGKLLRTATLLPTGAKVEAAR